ncbi:hypothetical protein [Bradyrhizobium betae]|uniref:Sel1 repeat family protein n=1 Tax=Bradyrhizobium betae TaxID=244734 RepID=A0A4Q1VRJ1_9BRAD|nr:hypothetical protein [Bradyrhizobium betae]RXT54043.1 hypothetical protein B5V03_00815 [Bradyrhizobium betae]
MGRTLILDLNTTCDVVGASRRASDETPYAPDTARHLSRLGWPTPPWLAAAVLVISSMSDAQASTDYTRYLLDARQASVPDHRVSHGMAGRNELAMSSRRVGDDKPIRLVQAVTTDRGEPQQSPELEPRGPEALSCELSNAKHDIALLQGLAQEHDRAEQLEQALAAARRDVDAQTALAAKASDEIAGLKQAAERGRVESQDSLQQQRDRAARLEQALAVAHRDVEIQTTLAARASDEVAQLKQAAESGLVELQKSLQEERDRTSQLEQALAAARRDIDAQTALAATASDDVARLTQAEKAGATEQRQSVQKERERADALAQDLSMARSKIYAYEAQAAKASEEAAQLKQAEASNTASLGQSQQRERERAEQLARDLAKASRELDAQTERASKASEEVVWVKQARERDAAELRGLVQRERERAEGLERNLALALHDNGALAGKNNPAAASQLATTGRAVREEPLAAPRTIQDQPVHDRSVQDKSVQDNDPAIAARSPGDVQVNPDEGVQVARLMARASLLLEQGDIGAARIVLEHVAGTGNARAIFALAETYDPLTLPNFGTYGTRGDATKARDLYARAQAGGIKEAKARFDALGR